MNAPVPTPEAPKPTALEAMLAARDETRTHMGGAEKVRALHEAGKLTARDWITKFVDPDSFVEIGTFIQPIRREQRNGKYGDGKICGHGRVDGRPISVSADDLTFKAGTDARSNQRRLMRVMEQAIQFGNPMVCFGQAAGSRIPDILGSEIMSDSVGLVEPCQRRRAVPWVEVIVGRSFGESSFHAALSDFIVQVRGSTMAVTSPRVIETATSEQITEEELGGVDVHSERTGQIDLAVETDEDAIKAVKSYLSYLPSNANEIPSRAAAPSRALMPELRTLVPEERRRAYDMRKVIARLVDQGQYLELRPRFGRAIIAALARFDGRSVGILASQPMFQGGAMTPDVCDKAVRFICMCDSFNIPLIFLADSPGFLVGRQVEHSRLLFKAVMLNQALVHTRVPRISITLRKAYGLAYLSMSGGRTGAAMHIGWPTAEVSFMDPDVAANVVYAPTLEKLDPEERKKEEARLTAQLKHDTSAIQAASLMGFDEIIDPAETPLFLAETLDRLMTTYDPKGRERILATWPTCF